MTAAVRDAAPALYEHLWSEVGLSVTGVLRNYRIATPESPPMLIAETWRRGMLMEREDPART